MRSAPQPRSRRASWSRKALLALTALARLLSLLVCFELSGLERELQEVLVLSGHVEAHVDDCAGDAPHDCPPGCAACHCNAGAALPPEARSSAAFDVLHVDGTLVAISDGRAPSAPHLPGLFRPPRA